MSGRHVAADGPLTVGGVEYSPTDHEDAPGDDADWETDPVESSPGRTVAFCHDDCGSYLFPAGAGASYMRVTDSTDLEIRHYERTTPIHLPYYSEAGR